ncbi:hypothetical protein BD410DRAFT_756246 [Rickenella mellea]|uniref:BTB domain-containing protein n=1 Tax=Rickenella mellea TaxID=50990 RepID=A0A4Y7PKJ8_9AGAM|nr:hypothetical protein BD410DRAFT_756246 [Rickenella mellea]
MYIALEDKRRHRGLWFDDGNIVLVSNASIYRVHRGFLSMNSPVFAEMLSMPQPDTNGKLDGIPVVEISDSDADFTHLLHFFYNHRYYQGGSSTSFEKLSGLLRMSTKYQVDELRNEIISQLFFGYPSNFEDYAEAVCPRTQQRFFPPFDGQHFAVAVLARDTDASVILPAALWRSSCERFTSISNGIRSGDGT